MADEFDNRFTERARKVLVLAQEEARRMDHNYIGTEHLLVGLVKQGTDVVARVLRDSGVELGQVRERIEQTVGRGRPTPLGQWSGLTPRTKRVIELAVEEARRMGHHWIEIEHLLLGLIQEGDGLAVAVLRDLGVDLDAVRTRIVQMMPGESSSQAAPECTGCGKPLQVHWHFCPFCGTLAPGRCSQCQQPLPEEEGIQFCPYCGNKV